MLPDEREQREFLFEARQNVTICSEEAFTTQSASLFIVESSTGAFINRYDRQFNNRNYDRQLKLKFGKCILTDGLSASGMMEQKIFIKPLSKAV